MRKSISITDYYGVDGKFKAKSAENFENGTEDQAIDSETRPKIKKEKQITFFGAAIHFLSILISVNPLTIPSAFRSLGLVSGFFGILIVAVISTYGLLVISHISNHFRELDGKKGRPLYKLAERSMKSLHICQNTRWPKLFGLIVSILIVLNLSAVLTFYVAVTANNVKEACLSASKDEVNEKILLLLLVPILGVLSLVRNPRKITPFALIGTICVICGIMASLLAVMEDLTSKGVGDFQLFRDFHEFPIFLGVVVFAFGGALVVIPIENEMAQPHRMHKNVSVIMVSMVITTIILLICGLLGYFAYGTSTKPQLNQHLPRLSTSSTVLQLLMAIGILLSTPVLFQSIMEQVMYYFRKKKLSLKNENFIRLALVASTFVLPLIVENILKVTQIMSSSLALLQYVVPPIMAIAAFWNNWTFKEKIMQGIVSVVLITFGVYAFLSGLSVL